MRSLCTAAAALVALVFLAAGCASVEPEQFNALQAQVTRNQQSIRSMGQQMDSSRRPQADLMAEVASLRQDLARLRGQQEELAHNIANGPRADTLAESERRITQRQEELAGRLAKLEQYLGVKNGKPPAKKPPTAAPAEPAAPTSDKGLYELARRLYSQKSYQAARDQFEALIKRYPKSKYADNAQYWIGDSYYEEKKYEEAILAYNQVVKRYPKGAKAAPALLKQGLSFMHLGDKRTAAIVLKRLVNSYPKSSQAKTAKRLLKKL